MRFLEQAQIAAGFLPVDLQTATPASRQGDWVSLAQHHHLVILLYKDGGTANEDVTLTVEQATNASGGDAKPLAFTRIARKQGANLLGIGAWTETTQTASHTYTNATSGEEELLWVVEFDAAELDVQEGFQFVRASVNDVGNNPQLGCLLYLLTEPRFGDAVEQMASVLA